MARAIHSRNLFPSAAVPETNESHQHMPLTKSNRRRACAPAAVESSVGGDDVAAEIY